MQNVRKSINMTEGPFLKKIVVFIIPLILTGLLQCFYNAADLAVVGRFEGEYALAAVGSTGPLNNLIVGLFMGLSVGAGVVVAHHMGALKYQRVNQVVHSAVLLASVLGVVVAVLGVIFAPQLLMWMDTPPNVLDSAVLYTRIVFCGIPASMLYNYCAAMVRSTGDTKHPLIFLSISGLVNVILNLVLVIVFRIGVAGVAIGTIASQYLSAIMIVVFMCRSEGPMHLSFSKLRLHWSLVKRMMYIGIPSGLQGTLFSLSNVIIQTALNGFDSEMGMAGNLVAGNTAAGNLEGFVYIAMNAVYQAAMTFVGQNVGAKQYRNIKKVTLWCVLCVLIIGVFSLGVLLLFREFFVGLYVSGGNEQVMEIAFLRLTCILPFYWMCGMMEVLGGSLRGMGKSITAMVISLMGACVLRIVWIKTVFVWFHSLECVYFSYPVSWVIVIAFHMLFLVRYNRKLLRSADMPTLQTDQSSAITLKN